MGFGYGVGRAAVLSPRTARLRIHRRGGGGGGGGGGFSVGRPIAVVSISAEGVQVKPVVDVTKLGIAALTAFGAMALMWSRMNRLSRRR